jgi:helicase
MIRAAFVGIDRYIDSKIGAPLITNEQATLHAMRRVLDETLGTAGEDDIVILGFAGDGSQDHRLVLNDTAVDYLPGTTLGMDKLAQRFREKARAVILLLDCCFSGGAPARVIDAGLVPRNAIAFPLREVAGQGRILFAASSGS